ncbi:hypothetical protein [Glycomyces tenuis]|uniref:hypothetical protein n=1 Tax=Glycomyces tenuis TaxID=58116 RepID=UPI00041301C6|nr:hypothetical protein [Glycomyces tenuis]
MPQLRTRRADKVVLLPKESGSLTRELPPVQPGTLFVMGANGGMSVSPDSDFTVVFGRNDPEVHVCVGPDDLHVSRRHGYIRRRRSRWEVHNVGRLPIRMPESGLVLGGDHVELASKYTPLFIVAPGQEHLLEVRVAAGPPPGSGGRVCELETLGRPVWPLSPDERLVLVALGQRYLRGETHPQPLTWEEVAQELHELQPAAGWNWRKAARRVSEVRHRLSPHVRGLVEKEIPPPVGNALNHNLITELLVTTTITKDHLSFLEPRRS